MASKPPVRKGGGGLWDDDDDDDDGNGTKAAPVVRSVEAAKNQTAIRNAPADTANEWTFFDKGVKMISTATTTSSSSSSSLSSSSSSSATANQQENEYKLLYEEELARRKDLEELVKDLSAEIYSLKAQLKSIEAGDTNNDSAYWESLKLAEKERKSKARTSRSGTRLARPLSSNNSSNSSINENAILAGSNVHNSNSTDNKIERSSAPSTSSSSNFPPKSSKSKSSNLFDDESEEEDDEDDFGATKNKVLPKQVANITSSSSISTKPTGTKPSKTVDLFESDDENPKPKAKPASKNVDLFGSSDDEDQKIKPKPPPKNGLFGKSEDDNSDSQKPNDKTSSAPKKSKIDLFASDDDSDFENFLSKSVEKIRRNSINAKNIESPKKESKLPKPPPPPVDQKPPPEGGGDPEWERLAREVKEEKAKQRRQLTRGRPARRPVSSSNGYPANVSASSASASLQSSSSSSGGMETSKIKMEASQLSSSHGSRDNFNGKPAAAVDDTWSSDSDTNDQPTNQNGNVVNNFDDEWSDSDNDTANNNNNSNNSNNIHKSQQPSQQAAALTPAISEEEAVDKIILEWCTSTRNSVIAMIITMSSVFTGPLPDLGSPWSIQEFQDAINDRGGGDRDAAMLAVYTPSIVRKAYLNVVRSCHPDKIAGNASSYLKLLAMKVFTALTDAYNLYKNSV